MNVVKPLVMEERVLVLMPIGGDEEQTCRSLEKADVYSEPCRDIEQFCEKLLEGAGAGLIAGEALSPDSVYRLEEALSRQPHWSEFPLVIVTDPEEAGDVDGQYRNRLDAVGPVSLLERPVRTVTLISVLKVALKTRKHQYELRDTLQEKEKYEESLRLSEERYRTLIAATTSIVWTADADGRFAAPQASWEAFTGQSWDQYQGWGRIDAVHEEDRAGFEKAWRKAIRETVLSEWDGRLWNAAQQQYRYMSTRAAPLLDADGTIREWIGTDTDVHDRKMADKWLRMAVDNAQKSFAQLEGIVDRMTEALMVVDPQGAILMMNNASMRIHGLTGPKDIRRNLREYLEIYEGYTLDGRKISEDEWPMTRALRGETFQNDELRVFRKKSCLPAFIGSYGGAPVYDKDGRLILAIVTIIDITERKRAEDELARQFETAELERRRLKTVLDILPVGVFIGDGSGRIIHTNMAAQQIWGGATPLVDADQFHLYRGWWVQTGRPLEPHEWALARAIEKGEVSINEEIEIECFDGSRKTIINYASPIRDPSGATVGGVAVSVDITQRRQYEQQLKELNEHLEDRVKERTRSLVLYQDHLRELASDLTLTEQRERRRLAGDLHDYLAQMLVAGRLNLSRVMRTVRQPDSLGILQEVDQIFDKALRYSRTLITDLSPTVLYEAGLVAAVKWLGKQMEAQGLAVTLEHGDEPLYLPDDLAILLFQAIRELLLNVRKHAQVNEAHLILAVEPEGKLKAVVSDKGLGFSKANSDAMVTAHSGKYGLFNVQERLKAIGGSFEIHSVAGQGTVSTILVPLRPDPRRADVSALPGGAEAEERFTDLAHRTGRSIRILLADDHDIVRKGLRKLIESYPNIKVIGEATNGEEAVELARVLHPDAVVMDINMPKLNGIEATRRLKSLCPSTAVIGLSVHEDNELENAMREAGASAYLMKGGSSEALYRILCAVTQEKL